ncbi:MAG: delta-60 repeat domain-containing protein [Meiothermus sp.]|uniref:delta-60 repeat domain-containing protein n=1 Tax=Meiothermus sp. TaxID=1955249 RepID=UPI00298EE3C4|nr:delta-60 repeat domain-containing protein [Meiothermus sp.]MDW8425921.1 delta-60 repeat domain-containing protein [Meiothermus sp.]
MKARLLLWPLLPALLFACQSAGPPPALQLSLGQSLLGLTRGEAVASTLTLTPQGGFNAPVNLVLERQDGTPAPASLSLSPPTVAVSGNAPISINLTLASTAGTPTGGPLALRIRAAGGGLSPTCGSHCANFDLYVGAKGELDASFGTGGKVTTNIFGSSFDQAHALILQPDGKLVAAGTSENTAGNSDFALVRYNPDGTLDPSFGSGGKVTTAVGSSFDQASALVLQPDGKLVAAGYIQNAANNVDFALVRYNPNGSLDPSFGTGGKVTTDLGSRFDEANALVLQPDGRLVAAGRSLGAAGDDDFALVRYNPNGSLDPSFGTGGKVTTAVGSSSDEAYALVLQPDGKLVAAGMSLNTAIDSDFALVRYNPDGTLDTSFGTGGKVRTSLNFALNLPNALVLQPDGKLVAAGRIAGFAGNFDFALVRYNPDGSLDNSFGTGGKVTTAVSSSDDITYALVLQPDGKLVAAGRSLVAAGSNLGFALVRYNPNGSLDPSFGTGGKVTTDLGLDFDEAFALVLQSDGKLVAAGYSQNAANKFDFALVRYH